MFKTPTVFVIGAGASASWDFPIGSALRGEIGAQLSVGFAPDGGWTGELTPVAQAYLNRISRDRRALFELFRGMRSRLHAYDSIDEFIDAQQDEQATELAKLSIAQVIGHGEAEAERAYFNLSRKPETFLQRMSGTWLGAIATRMVAGVRIRERPDDISENVGFVIFNYDRAVEHFLHTWITQVGGGSVDAAKILNSIPIYHPYGTLGDLPWQVGPTKVPFGGLGDLYEGAASIRTFTEQVEDTAELVSMRMLIANATRIVFLGFGFHPLNMELLAPQKVANKHIYATTCGVPQGELLRIANELKRRFETFGNPALVDAKCDEFSQSYMNYLAS